MSKTDPREEAQAAIAQARKAAKHGDIAGAERWTKTAVRLAGAARGLGVIAPLPEPEEDGEELRAELRRRLMLFVEADLANQKWEQLHGQGHSGLPPHEPFDEKALEDIAMGRTRALTGASWPAAFRNRFLE